MVCKGTIVVVGYVCVDEACDLFYFSRVVEGIVPSKSCFLNEALVKYW